MNKFLMQLLCDHKYEQLGVAYIVDGGRDKRVHIRCRKCSKRNNISIFSKTYKSVESWI